MLSATSIALAQCPPSATGRPWRVFPLMDAPTTVSVGGKNYSVPYFAKPYATSNGPCTIAINDDLIVVGTYMRVVGDAAVPRPFVWLWKSQFGLTSGFHDLLDLIPGTSTSEPGFANDITNSGLVVGGRGGPIEDPALYAFAWSLPGFSIGGASFAKPLDTQSNSAISWSMAIAVEKHGGISPRIVGIAGQPACPTYWWPADYLITSTVPCVYTTVPQPPDDDFALAPNASHMIHFTDVAVGEQPVMNFEFASEDPANTCSPDPRSFDGCESTFIVGAQFASVGAPIWLRFDSTPPPAQAVIEKRPSSVRGISSDGLAVGSITKYVNLTNCRRLPALWDDPAAPVEMAVTPDLPVPFPYTEATIEGLSEPLSCPVRRLVGWSLFSGEHGIIWDRCPDSGNPATWCTYVIDDLNGNPISPTRQAFDVNSMGFIAVLVDGWAQVGNPPTSCVAGDFVGVIIPRSDLNFDRQVNGADLGILLGAWGSASPCVISLADINGDGAVLGADLTLLLGDWSSGGPVIPLWPCSADGCPQMAEASAGFSGGSLSMGLEALGFTSVDEFIEWSEGASVEDLQAVGAMLFELTAFFGGGDS